MKKTLLILLAFPFFLWNTSLLNAQCYGVVTLDTFAIAGATGFPLCGNTTFNLPTRQPNELIMISYSGWNGPGGGPVTVDGNPASYVMDATNGNSGSADVYAYSCPSVGTHTIVCSTNGYNYCYYNNFAAGFYCAGGLTPLTIASLTTTINTIVCTTGGTISDNITTTKPNSAIYCSCEINEGQTATYPISWTGANFLGDTHTYDGIDASQAYQPAPCPGTYTVTATNSSPPQNGCGGLTEVLVVIPPTLANGPCGGHLTVVPTVTVPACGQCNGSINLAVSGGLSPYTYSWSPNISTSASATGLCGGTYSVTINDASCPVNDTTIVFNLPANSLVITDTLTVNENCFGDCNGSTMIVPSGGHAPYTYLWAPIGQTTATATGLCAGTYTIAVSDINGCTATSAINITQPQILVATVAGTNILCNGGTGSITSNVTGGTAPYAYLWTPGGNTNANGTSLPAGTYTMAVVDANGCTASASTTITQPTAIAIAMTGPPMICIGGSGTLTANVSGGTTPYAYSWSSGLTSTSSTASITPLSSQTYTVYVTDANGCKDSGEIAVNLGPTLFASITGATSMCKGLSTTLCGNAKGGTGGNTYTWEPGGFATPCVTVSPTSTTTYTLSIVDNCGTTATTTAEVLINPAPVVNFAANLYQGCTPLCIQFYNTTTLAQGGQAAYLWDYGNGDTSHVQNPAYCYPDTGKYSIRLTVTSDSGCSSTLTKTNIIRAYQHPTAAFTYSPQFPTILTPTIQFTDNSADAYNILYWSWSFGDESDSTSSLQNPAHTYHDTGTYCANLVIMDSHGCTDTTTNCLVIEPAFNLYIPSAFSPNGDAKNPTFEPKGQYIKSFEMYIFDQWGMQIYHTTDITKGWNGTVNGDATVAQEGVYIYKITVTDSKKKVHNYVGNVTLIK